MIQNPNFTIIKNKSKTIYVIAGQNLVIYLITYIVKIT